MSNKYFALLTDSGANKLENAATSGNKLEITHMAVGDGHLPTPDANQSQLINEKHRAEIDRLFIDPNNPNQIIVEQIIPETEGNWWIREIGLFDEDNTLIAVGNCAALYKSQMQEQTVRMVLPIGDRNLTGWIAELISGLATRSYVRGKIRDHAESRNHPDATLKNKGFVILSNAVDSNSEAHAATSKAVKSTHELAQKAYNLADPVNAMKKWVPLTRKINHKELVNDINLNAADVDAYNRTETDALIAPIQQDVAQAMKLADTANQNATSAINNAESKVPLTRKINDKELVNDIRLIAADVDAYNKTETDALIAPIQQDVVQAMKLADTANQNATSAINNAENKVPLTRKINDKELVNDIRLIAADVDAYNKTETDALIAPIQQDVAQAMKLADTANQNAASAINNAENKVPLTRKINDKELVNDIRLIAADVDAYNKTETDALIAPIQQDVAQAMRQADTAIKEAESKVPLTRKINHKELVSDINLNAADVDAYNRTETDALIAPIQQDIAQAMKLADTANQNGTTAIRDAASKVPLTRRINGKELVNDIKLIASDVNAYDKEETDQLIDGVKELANAANNNADSKVPVFRTINNKALLTDIMLNASDVDTYAKGEIDQQINSVRKLANDANNNVNGKVPLTRTVNNKALLTDITLTALDVGTYNKNEIDSRLDKVTKNANGRLAKDENGADIPDKNAFVKNIGLGDLIGSKIESQLIGQDATIINLGKITQISGVAIASAPIKQENTSIVGGVTYYTNYYKIRLPVSLPNGIISCHASIACNNFDSQLPSHLADVRTQRSNSDGVGLSQDTLTISVTTPELGWTPEFYYEVTGY
ncbi:phage tail protein [Xenorhabdus stockiae]|uniref:phage tail protein n=1 Tax=Xenorhabdus stockiae TaxID=351614 RepID=UPI003CF1E419